MKESATARMQRWIDRRDAHIEASWNAPRWLAKRRMQAAERCGKRAAALIAASDAENQDRE